MAIIDWKEERKLFEKGYREGKWKTPNLYAKFRGKQNSGGFKKRIKDFQKEIDADVIEVDQLQEEIIDGAKSVIK